MTGIEDAQAVRQKQGVFDETTISIAFIHPGYVNTALVPLRMARKLNRYSAAPQRAQFPWPPALGGRYSESARMALEPWIVEAALERLGSRRLSVEEQETIVRATRTPWKVRWPAWWSVVPPQGAGTR